MLYPLNHLLVKLQRECTKYAIVPTWPNEWIHIKSLFCPTMSQLLLFSPDLEILSYIFHTKVLILTLFSTIDKASHSFLDGQASASYSCLTFQCLASKKVFILRPQQRCVWQDILWELLMGLCGWMVDNYNVPENICNTTHLSTWHAFWEISAARKNRYVHNSPSGWVDSDGIWLSCYVSNQAGAIWSLKLPHVYGIS